VTTTPSAALIPVAPVLTSAGRRALAGFLAVRPQRRAAVPAASRAACRAVTAASAATRAVSALV
jgi:hypothetical protein